MKIVLAMVESRSGSDVYFRQLADALVHAGADANLLVCGPSNREYANECIKAERLANGASNTNRDLVDVLIVPWLQ